MTTSTKTELSDGIGQTADDNNFGMHAQVKSFFLAHGGLWVYFFHRKGIGKATAY